MEMDPSSMEELSYNLLRNCGSPVAVSASMPRKQTHIRKDQDEHAWHLKANNRTGQQWQQLRGHDNYNPHKHAVAYDALPLPPFLRE